MRSGTTNLTHLVFKLSNLKYTKTILLQKYLMAKFLSQHILVFSHVCWQDASPSPKDLGSKEKKTNLSTGNLNLLSIVPDNSRNLITVWSSIPALGSSVLDWSIASDCWPDGLACQYGHYCSFIFLLSLLFIGFLHCYGSFCTNLHFLAFSSTVDSSAVTFYTSASADIAPAGGSRFEASLHCMPPQLHQFY